MNSVCDPLVLGHDESLDRHSVRACVVDEYLAANALEWDALMQRLLRRVSGRREPPAYPLEEPIFQILCTLTPELLRGFQHDGQSGAAKSAALASSDFPRASVPSVGLYSVAWVSRLVDPSAGATSNEPPRLLLISCEVDTAASKGTRNPDPHLLILLLCSTERAIPSFSGATATLHLAKTVLQTMRRTAQLVVLTCGALRGDPKESPPSFAAAAHGGVWGFVRCLRAEAPLLLVVTHDVFSTFEELRAAHVRCAMASLMPDTGILETVMGMGTTRLVPRLFSATWIATDAAPPTELVRNRSQVITGGLGGLGLRVATLLFEHSAASVSIASRSGSVARSGQGSEQVFHDLRAVRGNVLLVMPCDASVVEDVCRLMKVASATAAVSGSFHMTEVLQDKLVVGMLPSSLTAVLRPKALGAWHLVTVVKSLTLDFSF